MKIKDNSVKLHGLQPQVVLALCIAQEIYYVEYNTELVVTSVNDSRHSTTSLHYSGNAVDLRTSNLPDSTDCYEVAAKIKAKLNQDFDVLYEGDHIHLEYQPRR